MSLVVCWVILPAWSLLTLTLATETVRRHLICESESAQAITVSALSYHKSVMDCYLKEKARRGDPALLITLDENGEPVFYGSMKMVEENEDDENKSKWLEKLDHAIGDFEYVVPPSLKDTEKDEDKRKEEERVNKFEKKDKKSKRQEDPEAFDNSHVVINGNDYHFPRLSAQ